jgi:hypothetical protein
MILTAPNLSDEGRCYRFSQENFISKERLGHELLFWEIFTTDFHAHCNILKHGFTASLIAALRG